MAGGVTPGAGTTTGLTGTPGATDTQGATTAPTGATNVNPADYGDRFSQTPQFYNPIGGYGQTTLADYFASLPSYQQPGGARQGNIKFAEDLAAQTQAQVAQQDAALKAAEQERIRQSEEALKAYQVQKAKDEAAAAAAAAAAAKNRQNTDLFAYPFGQDPMDYTLNWDQMPTDYGTMNQYQQNRARILYGTPNPSAIAAKRQMGLAEGGLASLKGFNK